MSRARRPSGPQAWSPGFLVYAAQNTTTGTDLWVLPMTGTDRKPFFIVQTRFDEGQAQLSPDGRWIAYASNKTGEFEVYVTSFPTAGNELRVSTNGGMQPRWRRDGRELFYVARDGNLMAVPILGSRTESPFKPGTPIVLFRTQLAQLNMATGNGLRPQYAVAADGRFLMNVMVDETRVTSPISVVLNWAAAIKR